MKQNLKIAKLTDPDDCVQVEKALEAVPGVVAARIETKSNQAIVDHEGADVRDLVTAVKKSGFLAAPTEDPRPPAASSPAGRQTH